MALVDSLYWDGTGLYLFAKRLEAGKFVWPPVVDSVMVLTPAQLALLVEAMDWRRTVAPEALRMPVAVTMNFGFSRTSDTAGEFPAAVWRWNLGAGCWLTATSRCFAQGQHHVSSP